MKHKFLFLILILSSCKLTSQAQSIELAPFAGYTFRSTIDITGGRARVNDGFTYGGALTIAPGKYNVVEISYYRYQTTATAKSNYSGFIDFSDPIAVNYMLIGGQRLFPASEMVTGFSGFNIGASWLGSRDDKFSTITKFAVGIDAGVKIMATEKVGIRLQANLNCPISDVGGTFYWGTGGPGVGMSGYVPIWSFGFNGGLILRIK